MDDTRQTEGADRCGRFSFLVVGAGRGGTSLLMGMLDRHPQLEVAMEAHAMDCLMGFGLDKPAADFKDLIAVERCRAFRERCDAQAATHPGKIWGNKITTEQLYGLEDHNVANGVKAPYLKLFFNHALAGVAVIFVLRDGRTCVRSKLSRTGQLMEHACMRWKYAVRVMRFVEKHHPAAIVLRYEDLVRSPGAALEGVCAFLDIPYDARMLEGPANEKIPEEYRTSEIRTDSLSLAGVPELCEVLLRSDLLKLGYLSRARYWLGRIRYSRHCWRALLLSSVLGILGYVGWITG